MRKTARLSLALIAAICLLPSCNGERLTPEIRDAWARPGDTGQNSAVYFSLQNTAQEDKLLEVRGEVAELIQLHETIIDSSGTASMHHLEEIPVGANQRLEFEPGGQHVMLVRLLQPLKPGDTFDLTLLFLEQGEIHVQVAVENP